MEGGGVMSKRLRVGQIWTDPTGNVNGYCVESVKPFRAHGWGRADVRPAPEEIERLTAEQRERRWPRLHNEPSATPEEIRSGLIGRAIVDVKVYPDEADFPQGDGDVSLVLDDGNVVEFRSWGYDAWGVDTVFDEIPTPAD